MGGFVFLGDSKEHCNDWGRFLVVGFWVGDFVGVGLWPPGKNL